MAFGFSPVSPMDCPQQDLLNALSALHMGGKYSDLTVVCNYRQWAVHRAIVCSRSGFFDGACANAFRESESRTIDLSEDDEDAVDLMIHFFYHLDYYNKPATPRPAMFRHRAITDARKRWPKKLDLSVVQDPLLAAAGCYAPQSPLTPPASAGSSDGRSSFDFFSAKRPSSPVATVSHTPPLMSDHESEYDSGSEYDASQEETHLIMHTKVYALAEKYDIPSLKQLAKSKFEAEMACNFDSSEFAEAIEEVYCSTIDSDRGLRDVVLQAFTAHPELASTTDVYDVIEHTPSLALDLFKLERGIPV